MKADKPSNTIWKWNINNKKNQEKQFPVTEFLQENYKRVEDSGLGPGAGIGIGCGIGAGFGLVGGVGFGGWPWNHLKFAFGVGAGCGVGVGFGYGFGFGNGSSWDSLRADLMGEKRKSSKTKRNNYF